MPPTPSALLRQILTPSLSPVFKTPYLPLLAKPHLKIPLNPLQIAHLRPSLLQNAFLGSRRTFGSSPATRARLTEFANGFRSHETNAWMDEFSKEKAFMREQAKQAEAKRLLREEKLRKHEECMRQIYAYKSRIRQYLLRVYRHHFRFSSNRSRSSSWRPARLCFRTPTLSSVLRSQRKCDEVQSKLCSKFLYALMDERRRYQPQRAAHFRHLVKIVQSEVALHYARGSRGGCMEDLNALHHHWCPKKGLRKRFEAELGFGIPGGGGGGGGGGGECYKGTYKGRFRKHQHKAKDHDGNFDYSTFRKAYWYSRTHSNSRPYNHHREWTRRKHKMMWTRPQEWVMLRDGVMRRRTGSVFITWDQCGKGKEAKGVTGRGGNGGISRHYKVKINSVRLETPRSLRPTPSKIPSSLHLHSARPRLSLPILTTPSLFSRARLFSSSRPRSGLHFIVPIAAALKSTEALHLLVWITRLSLTLLPLSVRAKAIFALRERYLRDPSSLTATIWSRLASTYYSGSLAQPSGLLSRFNALWGLPLLLISPFILLALVGFASLERTPVTGRWRFVMLSPAEESELVDGILDIGRIASPATTAHANNGEITPVAPEGSSLDWVRILRQVLSLPDEGVDPETGRRMLLGGVVLDQRDWRVRWSEAVLRALEKGVVEGLTRDGAGARGEGEALRPPPSKWPLEGRSSEQSSWKEELIMSKHLDGHASSEGKDGLKVEYDILVIDRDENNAFSFGFGPEKRSNQESGRRGVIVVYTGFLKEVLGETMQPSPSVTSNPQSNPTRLASFFSRPSTTSTSAPEPDAIASYLVPSTLPTQEQCKSLAVLLSHETAHLILSHTLESYASMNLLMPHLSRLASDVLRTLLYPLTAILGPFINDAVGQSLSEGAKGGFGLLGSAANSCESQKLESEADLVALRLLAGSGIDPRFALSFWEDRLSTSPLSEDSPATSLPRSVRQHSKPSSDSPTGMLDGYMRTHPVDRERLDKIREELKSWEEWNQQNKSEAALA